MEPNTMAEKIWDLANLVTAFSLAQSLGTVFAVLKGDLDLWLVDTKSHRMAGYGIFVFVIIYTTVIIWCGYNGIMIDSNNSHIWCTSTIGRFIGRSGFNAILFMVLIGNNSKRSVLVHSSAQNAQENDL